MSEPKKIYGFPVAKIAGFPYGEWSTEPPAQGGWYWLYGYGRKVVRYIEIFKNDDDVESVKVCSLDIQDELNNFTHFLGPLPIPDMPE